MLFFTIKCKLPLIFVFFLFLGRPNKIWNLRKHWLKVTVFITWNKQQCKGGCLFKSWYIFHKLIRFSECLICLFQGNHFLSTLLSTLDCSAKLDGHVFFARNWFGDSYFHSGILWVEHFANLETQASIFSLCTKIIFA